MNFFLVFLNHPADSQPPPPQQQNDVKISDDRERDAISRPGSHKKAGGRRVRAAQNDHRNDLRERCGSMRHVLCVRRVRYMHRTIGIVCAVCVVCALRVMCAVHAVSACAVYTKNEPPAAQEAAAVARHRCRKTWVRQVTLP